MFQLKNHSQSLGNVVLDTMCLTCRTWGKTIGPAILAVIVGIVFLIIGYFTLGGQVITWVAQIIHASQAHSNGHLQVIPKLSVPDLSTGRLVGLGIIALIGAWFLLIIYGAVLRSQANVGQQQSYSFGEALGKAIKWSIYLFAKLIVWIIVMGVAVWLMLMMGEWVSSVRPLSIIINIIIMAIAAYIGLALVYVVPAIMLDGKGFSAFGTAFCFISRRWWRSLISFWLPHIIAYTLVFLLPLMVLYVLLLIPTAMTTIVGGAIMVANKTHMPTWVMAIFFIVMIVASIIYYFVMYSTIVNAVLVQYNDLKHRRQDKNKYHAVEQDTI